MLEPVLRRTAAKLDASGALDAPAITRLLRALTMNRIRSVAELSALLEEPTGPAEAADHEDQLADRH